MQVRTSLRWLLVAVLLCLAGWSANLALFNWWVAGGPPTPNPQLYERRGNLWCGVTLLLVVASGVMIAKNVRRSRRLARGREMGSSE